MLRVGLTGNVASGKSTVADAWRSAGVPVIDADRLAREAVAPGSPGYAAVVQRFGTEVVGPGGELDRAALRRIVFVDDAARADLEAIVHPEVARLRTAEEARAAQAGAPLVVHEIPLLFEKRLDAEMDVLVVVHAGEAERLHRLVERRGLTESEARAIMDVQMPASEKRERADIVIENSGTVETLLERAAEVLAELRRRAAGAA